MSLYYAVADLRSKFLEAFWVGASWEVLDPPLICKYCAVDDPKVCCGESQDYDMY